MYVCVYVRACVCVRACVWDEYAVNHMLLKLQQVLYSLQQYLKKHYCISNSISQVREVQRAFVLEMLRSSNFNKLLSATRECFNMVKRSQDICAADDFASLKVCCVCACVNVSVCACVLCVCKTA